MIAMVVSLVCGAGSWVADLPPDSELWLRVAVGQLYGEGASLLEELQPFRKALPPGVEITDAVVAKLTEVVATLRRDTGLTFNHKNTVLTGWLDQDAKGGPVWALVVRGAQKQSVAPEAAAGPSAETFDLEGQAARRLSTFDLAWFVRPDGTLVVGNERGVTRALHQLLRPEPLPKQLFASLVQRLIKPGPVALVWLPLAAQRSDLAAALPAVSPVVREVQALSIDGAPGRITLRVVASTDKGQKAMVHAIEAMAALWRAGASLTEAGGEAALGLGSLSQWPPWLPKELDEATLTTLLAKFVRGFTLQSKVMARPNREVEAVFTPNQMRGLLASTLLYATYLLPKPMAVGEAEATLLLVMLRKAEELYQKRKGEFLACGPVPAELPEVPTELPAGSCFAELGYKPPMKVRFQLAAVLEAGKLLLLARGDADGDGEPEVWALDEDAKAVRRVLAEPSDDE